MILLGDIRLPEQRIEPMIQLYVNQPSLYCYPANPKGLVSSQLYRTHFIKKRVNGLYSTNYPPPYLLMGEGQ